jgi:translation initiation factor 4B
LYRDHYRDGDRRPWRRDNDRDRLPSDERFERREAPRERPRLQLKPRSVSSEGSELSPSTSQSAIFGSAKPVDTATKERQIEERLCQEEEKKKEQEEEEKAKKQTSIFGNAKPVDTAVKEREIEERLRQREDGKKDEDEKKEKSRRRDDGRGLGPAWRSEKDRERDRGRGRGRGRGREREKEDGKRDERRDDRRDGEGQVSGAEKDGKIQYEEPQQVSVQSR